MQEAIDRPERDCEIEISESVGYRSAFIGAVLANAPRYSRRYPAAPYLAWVTSRQVVYEAERVILA